MSENKTKVCGTCREEKSVELFYKRAEGQKGYKSDCKICYNKKNNARKKANPEKVKVANTKYRAENKDKAHNYYLSVKDRIYAQGAIWRINNPEKVKESHKKAWLKWRTTHPDRWEASKERSNAHKRANPDKSNAQCAKRRASKFRATPGWADLEAIKLIYKKSDEISKETGVSHHVDHIVPLYNPLVCGLHCEANLRIIPASENLKKGNRTWPDMP